MRTLQIDRGVALANRSAVEPFYDQLEGDHGGSVIPLWLIDRAAEAGREGRALAFCSGRPYLLLIHTDIAEEILT